MVAKDDEGQPAIVPGLRLETSEDTRRFLEAIKRREVKEQYSCEFDNARTRLAIEQQLHLMEKERCEIGY